MSDFFLFTYTCSYLYKNRFDFPKCFYFIAFIKLISQMRPFLTYLPSMSTNQADRFYSVLRQATLHTSLYKLCQPLSSSIVQADATSASSCSPGPVTLTCRRSSACWSSLSSGSGFLCHTSCRWPSPPPP